MAFTSGQYIKATSGTLTESVAASTVAADIGGLVPGLASASQQSHIADPSTTATNPNAMAALTFTTHSWDGATDPSAAEGNQIVADLAAAKTAIDANNAQIDALIVDVAALKSAIDSVLAQLATVGIQASS